MTRIVIFCLLFFGLLRNLYALPAELQYLKEAYPETLQNVTSTSITWRNGTSLRVTDGNLLSRLLSVFRKKSAEREGISIKDIHCDNYEPFFKKMYGGSANEVKKKLVTVYWMPQVFGQRYPLKVTTVNDIHKKIQRISAELSKLPFSYHKYLENPAGSFYWRTVKGERYLSAHSFGIAIDINSRNGNYWLWDWLKAKKPSGPLTYRNNVPKKIIEIFEKEGFLWGGRWYFYDTMHFEYRPELFTRNGSYHNQIGVRCET